MDLTKRQQEIFDFIKRYSADNGYPPTVRDIGKAVGLASSSTVHAHLANLEKLGLLRRDPSKPRAIEMLDRAVEQVSRLNPLREGGGLPVVGMVAAGAPVLAEENIEEYVAVPPAAGGETGEYVLRVRGDSMVDAGILEGDYVVVRPQSTASDGEIVVALVGDESATVKRFFHEGDHIRLQPENSRLDPILSSDVQVLGKVVGLFRSVT
ncbi:MAG: transcriptional repressor LexA [Solirubrobacteraceae bacterium]